MDWLAAPEYWLARWVFTRALGAIYLIAFIATINQWRPLLGTGGLTPAPRLLEATSFAQTPSVFHWRYSDRLVMAVSWVGVALSAATVVGLPQQGPVWLAGLVWLVIWAAYLSIVNVGRVWYGFGWESILLEAGFLAAFVGSERVAPPIVAIFLIRWLAFRVEFGAGLIKLRGDRCWRDLTCLYYHHETQPLPNAGSWLLHRLPKRLHKAEVAGNHVAQLIAPFGLFAPQPVASIAAGVIIATQGWLLLSGNFSWLNVLTITLVVPALSGGALDVLVPVSAPALVAPAVWFAVVVLAVAAAIAVMSWWPIRNMASRHQRMNASFNNFHLVGTYGAFGSVTKQRFELVIEATTDSDPDTADWKAYEFKAKPTDVNRRPPQIAPYHLRLDWLLWFAAMSPRPTMRHQWFPRLLERLLEADPAILGLIRHAPFDGRRPTFVRARRFRYRFTTFSERRETGAWWSREPVGIYVPAISREGVRG